jgi:hypothetical protein
MSIVQKAILPVVEMYDAFLTSSTRDPNPLFAGEATIEVSLQTGRSPTLRTAPS